MASKVGSQLRLQQITGSLTDIKSALPTSGLTQGTAVASLSEANIPDLESILEYYAKAIQNIHGNSEFGANAPGTLTYSSGNGIKALKPSDDNRQVLGSASVSSRSSISGLSTSNISDSTLFLESGTIGLSGSPSYSLSGNALVFSTSGGDEIAFRVVEAGSSSITVIGLPEASTVATMSVSGVSTIEQGNVLGTEWKNVRTRRVEGTSGLVIDGGSGVLDIDAASLDADFAGAGAMTFSSALDLDASALDADFTGAIDMQAGASSEIGLADGVLTLDLNGTDVGDGLLVDAEGSVTLEAAHASDGAMILNAGNSAGVIQMQNAGVVKLAVSGTFVEAYDQFRVNDATASTSSTTGALIVAGGAGFGSTVHMGGDIESDDAMAVLVSSGELRLSGSSGVEFAADGGFSFTGHSAGGLLLIDNEHTEPPLYRSNFSATTSIVGALNQLKSEISASEPTLFQSESGAGAITADINEGSAITLAKVAGDVASFTTAVEENKLDVYVNGQMMLSGSESERAAGTHDYNISGTNQLKFSFDLKIGDVVKAIDRT